MDIAVRGEAIIWFYNINLKFCMLLNFVTWVKIIYSLFLKRFCIKDWYSWINDDTFNLVVNEVQMILSIFWIRGQ